MAIGDTTDPGYKKAICSECGGEYDGRVDDNPKKTIKGTCSAKCSYHKKTGYWNPSQNPEVKAKKKASLIAHYGGPDGDYETAKKAVARKQAKIYKDKTGYVNPGQNPEVRAKVKKTVTERFGNGNYEKAKAVIHERQMKAYKDKNGYDNPGQDPKVRKKVEKTVRKKYGTTNVFQVKEIKEKSKETNLRKYGVPYVMQNKEIRDKSVKTNLDKYGVPYAIMKAEATGSANRISKTNIRWHDLLEKELGIDFDYEVYFSEGTDKAMQADLGHSCVLVDIDPTVSHNVDVPYLCFKGLCGVPEDGDHSTCERRTNDYHHQRALTAKQNGYSLLNVFDWTPQDYVLKTLRRRLDLIDVVDANNCGLLSIDQSAANRFLLVNSPLGKGAKQERCYGLTDSNGDLVQVMTFRKAKSYTGCEWELLRLCHSAKTFVTGGYERMFQQFLLDEKPKTVVADCMFDSMESMKDVEDLGFTVTSDLSAQCYWYKIWNNGEKPIKDSALVYGIDKVLHRPSSDFPDYDGSFETSNEGLMLKEGYVRVYDAGGQRMIWRA